METVKRFRLLATVVLLMGVTQSSVFAFEPTIKLAARKDFVLSAESRTTVLEVGAFHLADKGDAFLAVVEEVVSPFSFAGPEPDPGLPAPTFADPEEPKEEVPVFYNDESVLAAVAASFSEKVRGTIMRGSSSFLQIEGGTLLRPGTSFPVSIPAAKNQSFTLTVSEVSSDGYTLQLGGATKRMDYGGTRKSSGNIQFNN